MALGLALSHLGFPAAEQRRKEPSDQVNSVQKGEQLERRELCSSHPTCRLVSVGRLTARLRKSKIPGVSSREGKGKEGHEQGGTSDAQLVSRLNCL